TAPTDTRVGSQDASVLSAATRKGAPVAASSFAPATPTAAAATIRYRRMAPPIVSTIARGIVRRGCATSSPSVAMRAYPVYAKNRSAADFAVPRQPKGANGDRLSNVNDGAAAAVKISSVPTDTATITRFALLERRTPK